MLGKNGRKFQGMRERDLIFRNHVFSSSSCTKFTISFLIFTSMILINISNILWMRKGKLKLSLAPPGSKCSNNLPIRLCSPQGLSSYFLCQECSPISLQSCVLLLQVSPQIAPILTNFKVAYTSYSILTSFKEDKWFVFIFLCWRTGILWLITIESWVLSVEDAGLMNEWTHLPTII